MTNFKVGDTVKIIGNNSSSVNKVGDIGIVHEGDNGGMYRVNVEGRPQGGNWTCVSDMEPVATSFDVPIGYVGLSKDMNLKDGDKIKGVFSGDTYTITSSEVGGIPIRSCAAKYTLVSRASEWVLTDKPNYETHDVATHNGVSVAARKKSPVVNTISVRMYTDDPILYTRGTVQKTDGVVDWSTLTVD
jgi:hypothetical protein